MNRNQIKEKLIKQLGALDTDKNYLLNNFILNLFDFLQAGQGIKINGIGNFYKIECKILNSASGITKESNIIVFSESDKLNELISEEQIFWQPTKFDYEFNSTENLFSLSVGKDYLSNEFLKSGNLSLPVSEIEYHNLLESKLENLISNSTLLNDYQSEIPCLNIDLETKQSDFTIGISEKPKEEPHIDQIIDDEEIIITESQDEKPFEFSDLSFSESSEIIIEPESDSDIFNFSDDIMTNTFNQAPNSSEISESKKEDSIFSDLEDLNGILEQEEEEHSFSELNGFIPETLTTTTLDSSPTEISTEDEESINVSGEISWDKIISDINTEDDEIEVTSFFQSKGETNYQDEQIIDFKEIKEDIATFDDKESEIIEDEIPNDKDVFDNVISEIHKQDEEELLPSSKEYTLEQVEDQFQTNIDEGAESYEEETIDDPLIEKESLESNLEEEIIDDNELEAVEEEFSAADNKTTFPSEKIQSEVIEKKFSKLWTFLIALVFLISSGVVYYSFQDYFQLNFGSVEQINPVVKDNSLLSIEREFEIPVTYPYPAIEDQMLNNTTNVELKNETKADESSSEIPKKEMEKITEPKQKIITEEKVNPSVTKAEKISETIFKSGNTYIAQIASFKSEMIAQKEIDKIKAKGYSAFIERVELPNRGTWFRIKVSGFSSVNEAQNFQTKYNKGEI